MNLANRLTQNSFNFTIDSRFVLWERYMNSNIKGKLRNSIILLSLIYLFFPVKINAQTDEEKYYFNLDDAIMRTLEQNNQIKASRYALKKAKWDKRRAQTMLFPTITFNTRYTWIDDSSFALRDFSRYFRDGEGSAPPGTEDPSFNIPQTVFQNAFATSFDLNMTIFNWVVLNGLAMAGANQEAAEYRRNSTRDKILFEITASYFNVLYNQEILANQEEYLELSEINYEKALRMQSAGRYAKVDALRWKVDFQQQKSLVENSKSQLRSAKVILKRMLNLPMDAVVEVDAKIPQRFIDEGDRVKALTIKDILKIIILDDNQLIEVNAALKALESNTEISKLNYRNAYEKFTPNISLSYQYAWQENSTVKLDGYSPQTLMVNFSFPLFSSFQDYTALKSNYYEYQQSKEMFRDQLQNIRYILTETVNKIINLRTQRELSTTNIEYNEHNYRIVEQQHEKGLVSNIDFIDAKLNLQDAKLTDVKNNYDFISSILELYYLLGKLEGLIPEIANED